MDSIKQLIINKSEEIATQYKYDFMYESYDDKIFCQIVKRDHEGEILGTPLSFHLLVNEDRGNGEFIFYNEHGEFAKQQFDIFKGEGLIEGLEVIQDRLLINF